MTDEPKATSFKATACNLIETSQEKARLRIKSFFEVRVKYFNSLLYQPLHKEWTWRERWKYAFWNWMERFI